MSLKRRLTTSDLALTVSFTALYTSLSFLPLSQIIGLFGKAITAANLIAPIIGIILGAYLGVFSTFLGGIIALFISPYFSLPGLVAGIVTSLCSGLLYAHKRFTCALIYFSLLFFFGFYPFVGPVWLYPPLLWFQLIGFVILVSPMQSSALKNLNSRSNAKSFFGFFITFLTATLAGQIAGSLVFEVISWPIFTASLDMWVGYWQFITFLYPLERVIIALGATSIAVPLYKTLILMGFVDVQRSEG
ncbi:hypothetical protein C0195_00460 [Candidatus Bathyarchaeota archaeon]|nr:MAG: hypothetical protein C0195_00460 [Candidatus Bathyarchaeota archaeon]